MSVHVRFECDGCDAKSIERHFQWEFRSVSGRSYGFGSFVPVVAVAGLAPAGWCVPDPYTGCCYCAECWAEILATTSEDARPVPKLVEKEAL